MILLAAAAQAQTYPNNSYRPMALTGGGYAQEDGNCYHGTLFGEDMDTQTFALSAANAALAELVAGVLDFEAELLIDYRLYTWSMGNAATETGLTVSLADANGPVKVYDPSTNTWSSTPIALGPGVHNVDTAVYLRLSRRVDLATLQVSATSYAAGSCTGTSTGDQGYAYALVQGISLYFW